MPSVLIVGIGNILLRDEGVGVRAIEAMRELALPPHIELLDGGTSGADLIGDLADREKVIVIDAVQADAPAGAVFKFTEDDLMMKREADVSLHEFGLAEALLALRHLRRSPHEVVIFGIQPADISPGLELSPTIAVILPKIIKLALEEAGCRSETAPA